MRTMADPADIWFEHESAFVTSFVNSIRRGRFLGFLQSNRRRDLCKSLHHFHDFDARYLRTIPTNLTASHILELLKEKGAPERCVVISEDPHLDREMALADALQLVVGSEFGTVLSCLPGRLAFYQGEDLGRRYLLHRRFSSRVSRSLRNG